MNAARGDVEVRVNISLHGVAQCTHGVWSCCTERVREMWYRETWAGLQYEVEVGAGGHASLVKFERAAATPKMVRPCISPSKTAGCSIARSSTRHPTAPSLVTARTWTGENEIGNLQRMNERLAQHELPWRADRHQILPVEADKLKSVMRRTPLVDLSRRENSAEHSWHLVLVIMVMREYGPAGIDWMRVMEMVAVHDLVEIDAGDVSAYDVGAFAAKAVREKAAAERIFALLPADQHNRFRQLWDEFETHATPEARFANAVDRLQPLIQNTHAAGGSWCGQALARAQILDRMAPIESSLPDVWPHVLDVIESFCSAGVLRRRD